MAELENDCCAADAQANCCEPAQKASCCEASHGTGCGCGSRSRWSGCSSLVGECVKFCDELVDAAADFVSDDSDLVEPEPCGVG